MARRIRSIRGAAAWVDRVGLAVLYPSDDLVLPSLWEALTGRQDVDWAVREDGGKFVDFTPEFARVWNWKDELPEQRLVCAGKHLGGKASLVSLRMLPALYALTGRRGRPDDFVDEELSPVERDVANGVARERPDEQRRPSTRRGSRAQAGTRLGCEAPAAPDRHRRGPAGTRPWLAGRRARHPPAPLRRVPAQAPEAGRRTDGSRCSRPPVRGRNLRS